VAAASAALLGRGLAQSPAPEAVLAKVAVCDVTAVFNKYQRASDLSTQFAERARKLSAEDEQRKAAIQRLEQTLESLRPGSKEHDARLAEMDKLTTERQVWRTQQENQAVREHRRLTEEMYKEVLDAVAAVAKEKGYDLVLCRESVDLASATTAELLNKIAQRKCLYNNPALDVTSAVLDRLNSQYKGVPR
jgi:Skp family chaperone for outer membrane proteins